MLLNMCMGNHHKSAVSARCQRAAAAMVCLSLMMAFAIPAACQANGELEDYFKRSVGFGQEEIVGIRGGQAVAKVMKSRTLREIFVIGAVYIKATPEAYIRFANDFDRLRKLPEFLAIGKFSDPPQLNDLEGFRFDSDDIKALKECRPHDCEVQIPAEAIEDIHQSVNWNAPNVDRELTEHLHRRVITGLQAYRQTGNQALGVYADKENPTDVAKQFEYMLSYARALPEYVPELHRYLLGYPNVKSVNIQDTFYWSKVKFGLKPTLRIVQLITWKGRSNEPAYAVAEKQLYSSHYFETALDLTFCIRSLGPKHPGFYLIKAMGSEQAGLTGFKGSFVRRVAVDRTASSLEKSLTSIKNTLEREFTP